MEVPYQYKANVKDKVKKLEARASITDLDPPVLSTASKKSSGLLLSQNDTDFHSTSLDDDSPAAVMDVEITQYNSPSINSSVKEVEITSSNVTNRNLLDVDDEPVNVKSLLRRFSSGMTQTFKRKSLIPPSDTSEQQEKVKDETSGVTDLDDFEQKLPGNYIKPLSTSKSTEIDTSLTISKKPVEARIKPILPNNKNEIAKKPIASVKATEAPGNVTQSKSVDEIKQSSFGLSKLIPFKKSDSTESYKSKEESLQTSKQSTTEKVDVNPKNHQEQNQSAKAGSNVKDEVKLESFATATTEDIKLTSSVEETPKPKPRPRNVAIPNNQDTASGALRNISKILTTSGGESDRTNSMLVMGLGRAGKSSIVNYLLQQDLSTVYKTRPQERQIVECTARIQNPNDKNASTANSGSVVIIDTPGFTNTPEDACLFTTLKTYLKSHTSIKTRIPNLILVVIKYENFLQSLEEGGDALQNFLKALSHTHQNEFDSIPIIQFVMTHLTPLEIQAMKNISEEFAHAIKQNTSISNPTVGFHRLRSIKHDSANTTLYLENHNDPPTARDLLQVMRHLFEMHKQPTETDSQNDDDENMLEIAFSSNYPKSLNECFVSNRIPLASQDTPEVIKMQKLLQNIYQNMVLEKTEISTLLEIGWENVDFKQRCRYHSSLITLQQIFQRQGIKNFSNLPEEPMKILELLHQIPQHNPAIADLLAETLQLKIPSCYAALYIGQGFDVSKDSVTHVSPFQFTGQLKTSSVGLIPEEISCKITDDREIVFKFYNAFEDYVLDRFKDLGIPNVTFPKHNPPAISTQRIGYNVIKPHQEPTKSTVATASIEYRLFQLSLARFEDSGGLEFKPQFWNALSSLPELDVKIGSTVDCWGEFFNYWGTHVVKGAFGGGSIQVNFRGGKMLTKIFKSLKQDTVLSSDEYETSKVFQWITGDGLEFVFMKEDSRAEFLQGCDVDSSFQGGDMKFQQMDLTKLPHDKVSSVRNEWIQSLALNPMIMEANLILVPISFFVREKSEAFATKMDIAFFHFYSNFIAMMGKSSCNIL